MVNLVCPCLYLLGRLWQATYYSSPETMLDSMATSLELEVNEYSFVSNVIGFCLCHWQNCTSIQAVSPPDSLPFTRFIIRGAKLSTSYLEFDVEDLFVAKRTGTWSSRELAWACAFSRFDGDWIQSSTYLEHQHNSLYKYPMRCISFYTQGSYYERQNTWSFALQQALATIGQFKIVWIIWLEGRFCDGLWHCLLL